MLGLECVVIDFECSRDFDILLPLVFHFGGFYDGRIQICEYVWFSSNYSEKIGIDSETIWQCVVMIHIFRGFELYIGNNSVQML